MKFLFFSSIYFYFTNSLKEIYHNKVRSFLTILGILLGVFSLTAMSGIIEGAKQKAIKIFKEKGGASLITIKTMPSNNIEEDSFLQTKELWWEDIDIIQKENNDIILGVSPINTMKAYVTLDGIQSFELIINGIGEDFNAIKLYDIADGRKILNIDSHFSSRVCVLGSIPTKELFSGLNPVKRDILIEEIPFKVIGVYKHYFEQQSTLLKKNNRKKKVRIIKNLPKIATLNQPKNRPKRQNRWQLIRKHFRSNLLWKKNFIITIPIGTFLSIYESKEAKGFDRIQVLFKNDVKVQKGVEAIKASLMKLRGGNEDFEVELNTASLDNIESQLKIFKIILGSISTICLIVGGLGIMNIVLASLSERIREIGIRKSIGASNTDIFIQFLTETIVLSLLGGVLGIVITFLLSDFVENITQTPIYISLNSVIYSFTVCFCLGIFFGLYPATKASKLNPVEALRYD